MKRRTKFRQGKIITRDKQRGATMVEFVIAFPVMIFAFIGLFDFSRIILAKTILRNGAVRAAELATVIPNLEAEDDVNHPDHTALRQEALLAIYRRAVELPNFAGYKVRPDAAFAKLVEVPANERQNLPSNSQVPLPSQEPSLAAVKVTLPDPSTNIGVDINQLFQDQPIRIELNAEIHPFLPFIPSVKFFERIEVFREPRNVATKPVLLNCQGDPAIPGERVECPCPPAAGASSPPPNMVLSPDQTSCVCKETYTTSPGTSGCTCPATHDETTDGSGESYCACRLAACPMDPAHTDDPMLDQNFSMKECRCVDSPCPPGSFVREDGTCGGCNIQNCSALGPNYVPDPNDSCACKTCDQLFGPNPPRNAENGTCVCANKATDKPNCSNKEIWSDQQCRCVACSGHAFADETHTTCECNDDSVRAQIQQQGGGGYVCGGNNMYWDRDICACRSCVYGGYGDGSQIHVSEQASSTDVGNVDGHGVSYSCECMPNSSGTGGGNCSCINTSCGAEQWFDPHFCTCRYCDPGRTFDGSWCVCNQVLTTPVPSLCPAGQAFHGGGCWCYACAGFAQGYSDKASHGWTCDCKITAANCPANTHFVNLGISGCDCVNCTATDYQNQVPGCVCNPNATSCSATQSVDSTCQCHDCPPCQVRDTNNPAQCINPCGASNERCPVNGLCCLPGQHTVNGPSGNICVNANSPCEINPASSSCSAQGCVSTPLGPACQLVHQE